MKDSTIQRLAIAAMFLSLGLVLPFATGQIPQIGQMLLPMHLPVLLCGLICGARYGGVVGLILPIFRAFLFGMPRLYPNAVWMTLELGAYGFVIGLVWFFVKKTHLFDKKPLNVVGVYISLISAMLAGRIVWGAAKTLLLGFGGSWYSFDGFATMFIAEGFVNAFPGIILQLILIPSIMFLIEETRTRA